MSTLDLGIIGNCNFSALVESGGRIVWCCQPQFDGDPVFNALLTNDPSGERGGFFDLALDGEVDRDQRYIENTAVLVTTLTAADGSCLRITDFAPRMRQRSRIFRPSTLVRHVQPLSGTPRITVKVRPTFEYGAEAPRITRGSNHIRYVGPNLVLRLTTDATVSYVMEETPFQLRRPLTFLLGEDETVSGSVSEISRSWYDATVNYWRDWARSLSVPFEWQDAVIRAAITLKLCTFEETGAVIAAATTSVPEAANTVRCWDYRYCWLRDSYFVIHALNRLSATLTMEHYLEFITNVVATSTVEDLRPLYSIALQRDLTEHTVEALPGYRGNGPVRVGNEAYLQKQNDVYGSVVLSLTQSFFDRRLTQPGDISLFRQLEALGEKAAEAFDTPDAGIWELRTRESVHTFSAVMCWAAVDRLARIAAHLGLADEARRWQHRAAEMRAVIEERAWNPSLGAFTSTFEGDELDASQLLLHELGFLRADDPRFVSTVDAIGKRLRMGNHLLRYAAPDDFGMPETAFTICTFWYIEALASIGQLDEARSLFEYILECRNPLGLLSEDIDPETGELWGNFPQTYSMVGLITCAMRLSKNWEEAY